MRPSETNELRYNEHLRHFKIETKLELEDILEEIPIHHAIGYYGHEDILTEIGADEVLQFAKASGWINGNEETSQ